MERNSALNLKTKILLKFYRLKNKLKGIRLNWDKITINLFIGLAFTSILIGVIIFSVFLIKLSKQYSISGSDVLLDKSGQVGDFIGGVIGAIWSLTGVLLFYAALRFQSKELAENRKHFQMSRLTDIIYKQLDLFNSQILNFTLKDIDRDDNGEFLRYKGRSALAMLRKRVEKIIDLKKNKENDKNKEATYQFIAESFAFIDINKYELQNIYEELDNQVEVIRSILIKEDIPPEDLNELKALFFRNVGRDFLNSSRLLGIYLDTYLAYNKQTGKIIDELYSPEYTIKRKISIIEDFRIKRYDKQEIKSYIRDREMYNLTSY